jgi:hypothetical protein
VALSFEMEKANAPGDDSSASVSQFAFPPLFLPLPELRCGSGKPSMEEENARLFTFLFLRPATKQTSTLKIMEEETTINRIKAMLRQQEDCYHSCCPPRRSRVVEQEEEEEEDVRDFVRSGRRRQTMVAWMLSVAGVCRFNRETVEIAMNYVDRFLNTTKQGRDFQVVGSDPLLFQLVCMTSLYTAVKIHETEAIDPAFVASLSRGAFDPRDIEDMEAVLLEALEWRLHPPTATSFVREYLALLLPDRSAMISEETRSAIYELAIQETNELAVPTCHDGFGSTKPSAIALIALLNAMECLLVEKEDVIRHVRLQFAEMVGLDTVVKIGSNKVQRRSLVSATSRCPSKVTPPHISRSQQEQAQRGRRKASSSGQSYWEKSPRSVSTDLVAKLIDLL